MDIFENRPATTTILVVVGALSLVGFLTGTNSKRPPGRVALTQVGGSASPNRVPKAVSYQDMHLLPKAQVTWKQSVQAAHAKISVDQDEGLQKSLRDYLAERETRRAYEGAPPTIPHPVRQNSAPECMACHGESFRLREVKAGALPHAELTNCNQCHVPESGPFAMTTEVAPDPREVENTFKGQRAQLGGPRAWSVAPPQMPHTSWMRTNCLACHGERAAYPMRSSHPQRQNCVQCHAESAQESLRPGGRVAQP